MARLEAFRTQPGVREVEVLSEVEHLRRQLYCLWSVKPVGPGRNAVAP